MTDLDIQRIRAKADALVDGARRLRCGWEAWKDALIIQVEAEDEQAPEA